MAGDAKGHAGREGVIRFRYTLDAPRPAQALAGLRAAHARGLAEGWLGRDPARYEGLAYGNLSERAGTAAKNGFWVTASQRIDQATLDESELVFVAAVDDGAVTAFGSRPPSSETLTHAAVHAHAPAGPLSVLHGHAPALWAAHERVEWMTTPSHAANGTRAIADAVAECVRSAPEGGALAMLGHHDGILIWGPDFPDVLERLTSAQRALAEHTP